MLKIQNIAAGVAALFIVNAVGEISPATAGFGAVPSCNGLMTSHETVKKVIEGQFGYDSYKEVAGGVLFFNSGNAGNAGMVLNFSDIAHLYSLLGDEGINDFDSRFPGIKDKIQSAKANFLQAWEQELRNIGRCVLS